MIEENNNGGNEIQAQQEEAVIDDSNVEDQNTSSGSKVNPAGIRKSNTQGILNALSRASGQKLDSVEDAVAFIAKSTAQSQIGGNAQPVEEHRSPQQSRSVSNNDLQEQFQKLQAELSSKEKALKGKELESEILQSMGDRFDSDLQQYAVQKVKDNIQWNTDDNTYSIVNAKGQERYGQDGNPLTIKDLVNEVGQGNPKLLKQAFTQSGSGLRPGQTKFAGSELDTVPDFSKDPAAFVRWKNQQGLGTGVGLKAMGVKVTDSSPNRN
jgi:hypothetical protein